MSQFWSSIVNTLTPYVPGEQPKISNLIKLNTNENPYGPSPKVLEAIKAHTDESLRLYPDPNADEIKDAISAYFTAKGTPVQRDQVFVGNGSDEVLAHTFQALLKQDEPILFPDISYSFYPVYCGLYQVEYKNIPLTDTFEINPKDYRQSNGGIIFPNPNAPTGRLLALEAVEDILKNNSKSVVVVDEAYIDFGGQSAVSLVNQYNNLLVIQTLSKSRSLAGIRLGYAIGHPALIEGLERVKNSFNSYPIDKLAIKATVASFADEVYFEQTCARIVRSRDLLSEQLTAFGFEVIPSSANFVFAKHPEHNAEALALALRDRSIIVRYFNKPNIDQHLRISIGTEDECQALIQALREILTPS
ncbi:histidinol-phosphate transaminase [Litoribacillus peritrichatus]|uniref:Histidinol-phosphate aminotransferase n=1 Tax=Litoribacillus peritrichatus TaxID=718191 RepID=A0ABP7MZA1_9GAMM